MKILITGANGQVGQELRLHASQFSHQTIATDHQNIDICNKNAIESSIQEHKPDILINAAAYTAVDQAESEPEKAFQINADACLYLAQACKKANIPLLHISTDYVFDGKQEEPYLEADQTTPLNVYGASKAKGEELIRQTWDQHIILRTAWVFSQHGQNFVKSMLRLGHQHPELSIVADQHGGPTAASDIAKALLNITSQLQHNPAWGTYHYCGSPLTTWHDFATQVFTCTKEYSPLKLQHIHAITTSSYPTPAQRPLHAHMDCSKIKHSFDLAQPNWHDSLRDLIKEMSR